MCYNKKTEFGNKNKTMVEEIFIKTIRKYNLIEKREKILLGVSGGPDSLCLLYLFIRLRDEYKLQLICAHFNHALRDEADEEEQFVQNVCAAAGIKCVSEKKEVEKFFQGDSLEQTARTLRFDFFFKCARQFKIKKCALAHHKDDLVETMLMRLIRGTGLKGLRGFLPQSKMRNLTVIRPLIELRKEEILAWLKKEKIAYCVDKSNFEDKFFRNRIRLQLLPLLEKMNPQVVESMYQLGQTLSWDYEFIYSEACRVFGLCKKGETADMVKLDLKEIMSLHYALFNNVIRIAIEQLKGDTRQIEVRHLEEIRDLVFYRPPGSIVDLPNISIQKSDNFLIVRR